MKKYVNILSLAFVVLSLIPAIVWGATANSGSCGNDGNNLTWTLDSNGLLSISGSGKMADYNTFSSDQPWHALSAKIKSVSIGSGVTSIGSCAFEECSNLTGVTIGGNVSSIGDFAFHGCSALSKLTLGKNVSSIGFCAFCDCSSLSAVSIGSSVKNIGDGAFCDCSALTKVTIGNSVTTIGTNAFSGCSKLSSISFGTGISSIGYDAFDGTPWLKAQGNFAVANGILLLYQGNAAQVTVPDTVTRIGDEAFLGHSNLTAVSLPAGIITIGRGSFSGCSKLQQITIPTRVSSIGEAAFSECITLSSVTIPDSVKSIGARAFFGCTSLTGITIGSGVSSIGDGAVSWCNRSVSITVSPQNTACRVEDDILYVKTELLYCLVKKPGTFTIPSGVTSIGSNAFDRCDTLSRIILPNGVTSIGAYAFNSCSSLQSVSIPTSVTQVNPYAFPAQTLGTVYFGGTQAQWNSLKPDSTAAGTPSTVPTAKEIYYSHTHQRVAALDKVIAPTCTAQGYTLHTCACGATFRDTYTKALGHSWDNGVVTQATSYSAVGSKLCTCTHCKATKTVTIPKLAQLSTPTVTGVKNTATGVTVSWNAVKGAERYRVYYKGPNDTRWTNAGDSTGTSRNVTGLQSGNKYLFVVRCMSADGKAYASSYDPSGKTITYVAAPSITKLTPAVNGVSVQWKASAGAAKYRVFYKAAGATKWTRGGDSSGTNKTVTGLQSGTNYSFTIQCISSDGKSYTSSYNPTGKGIVYLSAPNVTAVSNTATGVCVKWSAVTGAVNYRVYYKTDGAKNWTNAGDTSSTSLLVSNLQSGTKYLFVVRCVNAAGTAYTSAYHTAGKTITYVAAPTITSVKNTANGICVTWQASAGAQHYRVFYKADGAGKWTRGGDSDTTTKTLTGLTHGVKYSFTIQCISADGKTYISSYDPVGMSIVKN